MVPSDPHRRPVFAGKGLVVAFIAAIVLVVLIASGALGDVTAGLVDGFKGEPAREASTRTG